MEPELDKLHTFGIITKIDLAKRIVSGVAMDETPDRDGEIYDYNSSKPYVEKWATTAAENTKAAGQEVSYGNLRSMHANVAAGKLTDLTFDDQAKSVPIAAKVLDDDEWKKVQEGVYTGFSVRGRQIGNKWRDGAYMRYTVDPIEISLVDLPCNPGATFEAVKADGSTEVRKFANVRIEESDEEIEKRTFSERRRKDLAAKGKALPDGSFPIENKQDLENAVRAIGRAKDPEAAKKHIIARAKELGATDLLPTDWESSTKDKAATAADVQKLADQLAELEKRLPPAAGRKEHSMTPEEIQKAAELKKAAAADKMKAARKASNDMAACVGGYCDHGDTKKCMEKADEAHKAIRGAFTDDDDDDTEAAKAAKAEQVKKDADKAEIVKRAKELGMTIVEPAAAVDPKVAELEKQLADLKEEVAKSAGAQRNKPLVRGSIVGKSDDANAKDEDVKKFAAIKKDDPDAIAKAASAVLSAEETVID